MFRVVIALLSAVSVTNVVRSSSQLNDTLFSLDFIATTVHFFANEDEGDNKVESFRSNKNIGNNSASTTQNWRQNTAGQLTGRTLIPLCCPYSSRLKQNRCVDTNGTFRFPPLYSSSNLDLIDKNPDHQRYFDLLVRDPCMGQPHFGLSPDDNPEDAFMLLDDGSIYVYNGNYSYPDTDYCFGIVNNSDDAYNVILCFDDGNPMEITELHPVGLIVSVPFLFTTFIVYTLIPEFNNMPGRTLRGYIGSLLIGYAILAIVQISPQKYISDSLCIIFAFVIHFFFLASFFWLNVMCFDIWWKFRRFESSHNIKQWERRRFIMYSIYAWGCASILTGICVIMNFFPDIPEHFIKPGFGEESCWFKTNEAKAVYFYGPMGITVLCNICFFVATALKILQHNRNTVRCFKGINSRRHDDNRRWFCLYLKLFVVMGINWSMEILSWLCNNSPAYIWYLTDFTNTLQGVFIFLIFVWKENVKQQLLEKFGCNKSDKLQAVPLRSSSH